MRASPTTLGLSVVLTTVVALVGGAGCGGGDGGIGASCDGNGECAGDLQCLDHTCVARCRRAPDCGDGHSCTTDGYCVAGNHQAGDRCASEVECEPGLACVLDVEAGVNNVLEATCAPDHDGHAFGTACEEDADCRNSTCALGRCVDVCADERDCASGTTCTTIPRIDAASTTPVNLGTFRGCLPASGTIEWTIPVSSTSDEVYLPVPGHARSALAVMSLDDKSQFVGATRLLDPFFTQLHLLDPADVEPFDADNRIRHTPTQAASVMMIPSRPDVPLSPGAYLLGLSSFRLIPTPAPHLVQGTATPRLKAVVKLGDGTALDLHFYFLDLADHPCQGGIGMPLNATTAADPASMFQKDYVAELREIFARAGIALGPSTYDDLLDYPELDGLDSAALPDLLKLARRRGGVSVFIVRTISPVGLQALAGGDKNPGDPSLGSPLGGVAVALDTICYRNWRQLGRVTAHAIARYMGLFRNVEPAPFATYEDPIADSPGVDEPEAAQDNLMFYSEFGGAELSNDQEEILRRSAVLR